MDVYNSVQDKFSTDYAISLNVKKMRVSQKKIIFFLHTKNSIKEDRRKESGQMWMPGMDNRHVDMRHRENERKNIKFHPHENKNFDYA